MLGALLRFDTAKEKCSSLMPNVGKYSEFALLVVFISDLCVLCALCVEKHSDVIDLAGCQ